MLKNMDVIEWAREGWGRESIWYQILAYVGEFWNEG